MGDRRETAGTPGPWFIGYTTDGRYYIGKLRIAWYLLVLILSVVFWRALFMSVNWNRSPVDSPADPAHPSDA